MIACILFPGAPLPSVAESPLATTSTATGEHHPVAPELKSTPVIPDPKRVFARVTESSSPRFTFSPPTVSKGTVFFAIALRISSYFFHVFES